MNGPRHYQQAQKWAEVAAKWFRSDDTDAVVTSVAAAAIARAHAELANTAATVRAGQDKLTVGEQAAWDEVLRD